VSVWTAHNKFLTYVYAVWPCTYKGFTWGGGFFNRFGELTRYQRRGWLFQSICWTYKVSNEEVAFPIDLVNLQGFKERGWLFQSIWWTYKASKEGVTIPIDLVNLQGLKGGGGFSNWFGELTRSQRRGWIFQSIWWTYKVLKEGVAFSIDLVNLQGLKGGSGFSNRFGELTRSHRRGWLIQSIWWTYKVLKGGVAFSQRGLTEEMPENVPFLHSESCQSLHTQPTDTTLAL